MPDGLAYVNGDLVPEAGAALPVTDRGTMYGDAVFETMRAYGGRVFRMDAHLARLFASCEALGFRPREPRAVLAEAILNLIERNACPDAYVRLQVSRGCGTGPLPKGEMAPNAVILARPVRGYPARYYRTGMALVTSSVRVLAGGLGAHKTASYLACVTARREAAAGGADEAVLLNEHGRAAECAAANLFAVAGGVLVTPPASEGGLPGVTRAAVLELARRARRAIEERPLPRAELDAASEIFLTNSILELAPACALDERPVGSGRPGEVWRALAAAYREEVRHA